MSFQVYNGRICLAASVVALCGVLVCSVQAGGKERGRPIEFSESKSDEVTTNLHQLTSKKDSLRQLEEDLYRPMESLAPKSSLDGVVARPPQRATPPTTIQNKRIKEMLERRRNWVFMTPEDLLGAPTVEEILKTPKLGTEGKDKKGQDTFERYYERLAVKRAGIKDTIQPRTGDDDLFSPSSKPKPKQETAIHEDPELPTGLKERALELNGLFDPGKSERANPLAGTRGSLEDIFGLAENTLSKEQIEGHKKFLNDYHSLVDPTWRPPSTPAPADLLATVTAPVSPNPAPAVAALPTVSSPAPNNTFESPAEAIHPKLGPAGLPDLNAKALGQTKPVVDFSSMAPVKVGPASPSFAVPTRSFR